MQRLIRLVRIAVATMVIGYVGLFAVLALAQQRLLYHADPVRTSPETAGLRGVAEVELAAPDGTRLIAWHGPAQPGKPTLLYFHGQGGSLRARTPRVARFMGQGLGVFILTWRGYGGSGGSPSEAANVADGLLAYDHLRKLGLPPTRIVLYGESLGTGVAVQVARVREVAGVILDAPYTATVDVAAYRYPYFPVRLAMRDTYDSKAYIKDVHAPLLVLHGERDTVIPVEFGRRLFEAANEPKTLALFARGGHTDLYFHGALEAVTSFLDSLERGASRGATNAGTAGRAQ